MNLDVTPDWELLGFVPHTNLRFYQIYQMWCGNMKTLDEIRQRLIQHKSVLQERFKVIELGIFGSYAREEQAETSDVDVLVEFSETPSLLKFVNLENYLSDNLGVKVDLVHKAGL